MNYADYYFTTQTSINKLPNKNNPNNTTAARITKINALAWQWQDQTAQNAGKTTLPTDMTPVKQLYLAKFPFKNKNVFAHQTLITILWHLCVQTLTCSLRYYSGSHSRHRCSQWVSLQRSTLFLKTWVCFLTSVYFYSIMPLLLAGTSYS